MNKGSWCVAGGLALGLAVPASAADAPAEKGWFVEARVIEAESAGGAELFLFDDERSGATVAGGYTFTRHLSLEAAYHDLREHDALENFCDDVQSCLPTFTPIDIRALSVAAIGTWRVAPSVEVFGKLGVLGSRADYELAEADDTDSGALAGAGVGIYVTPRWRLNVLYERVDHSLELDSAGVGITYKF